MTNKDGYVNIIELNRKIEMFFVGIHRKEEMSQLKLVTARAILDLVLELAEEEFMRPVAVCVLDARKVQLAAAAQDDVKPASVTVAYAKAVTCLDYGRDTVRFRFRQEQPGFPWVPAEEGWSENDITNAMKVNPIFCCWAGGTLICHPESGEIMGAVAVSGLEELEDHDLASSRPEGWLNPGEED